MRKKKSTHIRQMDSEGNSIHLFTAQTQSATRYVDRSCNEPMTFHNNPRRQLFALCCKKRRYAKKPGSAGFLRFHQLLLQSWNRMQMTHEKHGKLRGIERRRQFPKISVTSILSGEKNNS